MAEETEFFTGRGQMPSRIVDEAGNKLPRQLKPGEEAFVERVSRIRQGQGVRERTNEYGYDVRDEEERS